MITPRYLYRDDFSSFRRRLASMPHETRRFEPGAILWGPGEYVERVHYIERGIIKTSLLGDDGTGKTVFFHGPGTVFPGCHESRFTIELSLITEAVTAVDALEFPVERIRELAGSDAAFGRTMLESYARYINLLIFESAHQSRNRALVKLSNLLYLLARDAATPGRPLGSIALSQEELAGILALNRVSVARLLARLREEGAIRTGRGAIDIIDEARLLAHCSPEVR